MSCYTKEKVTKVLMSCVTTKKQTIKDIIIVSGKHIGYVLEHVATNPFLLAKMTDRNRRKSVFWYYMWKSNVANLSANMINFITLEFFTATRSEPWYQHKTPSPSLTPSEVFHYQLRS